MADRLPDLGAFIAAFAPSPATAVQATEISLDIPIELDVHTDRSGGGDVTRLGGSSSTQIVATTIMPAYHRLRVSIVASEE